MACLVVPQGQGCAELCRSSFWILCCCFWRLERSLLSIIITIMTSKLSEASGSVGRPSSDIPHHVLVEVLRCLPAVDVLNASLVCKSWNAAAKSDDVWEEQCHNCWSSKVYVQANPQMSTWKEKYMHSFKKGRSADISRRELCTFDWRFR